MTSTRHLKSISRPREAELQPIWEFIYIAQAGLGLIGTISGFGLQFLTGIQSTLLLLLELKNAGADS